MNEDRPYPEHYIRHGLSAQRAAVLLLANREELPKTDLSVSIGLTLHAMELFGKAILRSFGLTRKEMRKEYQGHPLLDLLRDAQNKVNEDPQTSSLKRASFLSYKPQSLSWKPFYTIESALTALLEEKGTNPRDYLYPDKREFHGLEPFGVLPRMAHYLGKSSLQISHARGWIDQVREF